MFRFRGAVATLAAFVLAAGCASAHKNTAPNTQAAARGGVRPATMINGQAPGAGQDSAGPRRPQAPRPYATVITKEAKSDSGLFTVHTIGEKLFYEVPRSMLGREMLLVSRIAQTASNIGYGGEQSGRQVVRWQRQGDRVLLRTVSYDVVADDSLPIARAVRAAQFEPIIRSFPVAAFGPDSSLVLEVTDLFTKDVPILGLPNFRREQYRVRRMDDARAYVASSRSFPQNIEVRHVLTYEAGQPPANSSTGTISLEMNQSMVLLPERKMQPRYYDERVGFFPVRQVNYGLDVQRAESQRFIARWRLEPKDTAAFLRGELVEPVKPIVYYIDPATPMKWRSCIKQGVEDWNEAFAEAGFKRAILARDPPSAEEDPEFSPEDARYSVIRYFPSETENAYGPHVADPRTGEILESDIGWYHNVMNLLRNWYLIQTAAANPEARRLKFEDPVMCRLIRYVSAHEVGHTLGLPHNMKASAAFPVDSLRSATFTQKYGTTPSIMDYARFNYVAQPEDRGVAFLPGIGIYDKYAIRWGYRPVIEAGTPDGEKAVLARWVKEHEGDPAYLFGDPTGIDPTSQTEAVGDDAIKASNYGLANLKRILPRLQEWSFEEGKDYADLRELYDGVVAQWGRYMGHVATSIGGVVQTRKTMDQPGPVYEVVPEREQRRAMAFLEQQAFRTPAWMVDHGILLRVGNPNAVEAVRTRQVRVLENILEPRRLQRLSESEAVLGPRAYTLGEMLGDLRRGIWSELAAGRTIDIYRRNLQRGYLDRLQFLMVDQPAPAARVETPFGTFTPPPPVNLSQSDVRALVRGELRELQQRIRASLPRVSDRTTRLHLQDALVRIGRILDPKD